MRVPSNTEMISPCRKPGGCRRRLRLDLIDHRSRRRIDQNLPDALAPPSASRRDIRCDGGRDPSAVTLDHKRDRGAFASNHIPSHAIVHSGEACHGFPSTSQNLVTGLQTGFFRRRIVLHVADHGSRVRLAHWMTDSPDDDRKDDREEKAEKRPGDRDDDFIECGNRRELGAIDRRFRLR